MFSSPPEYSLLPLHDTTLSAPDKISSAPPSPSPHSTTNQTEDNSNPASSEPSASPQLQISSTSLRWKIPENVERKLIIALRHDNTWDPREGSLEDGTIEGIVTLVMVISLLWFGHEEEPSKRKGHAARSLPEQPSGGTKTMKTPCGVLYSHIYASAAFH